MKRWDYIENIVIYTLCPISVAGLFLVGAGGWSFSMLLMLLFANYPVKDKSARLLEPEK